MLCTGVQHIAYLSMCVSCASVCAWVCVYVYCHAIMQAHPVHTMHAVQNILRTLVSYFKIMHSIS